MFLQEIIGNVKNINCFEECPFYTLLFDFLVLITYTIYKMGIIERIGNLQEVRTRPKFVPSPKLQGVLARSGMETMVEELSKLAEVRVDKELIERGKKMVIVAEWPTQDEGVQNQLVISVCENSISFIGNASENQYLRMEGAKAFKRELAEEYLAKTFLNPSKINRQSRLKN